MKKKSRISLDQLRREFTPLSRSVQQQIIGGGVLPHCMADAIMKGAAKDITCSYFTVSSGETELI